MLRGRAGAAVLPCSTDSSSCSGGSGRAVEYAPCDSDFAAELFSHYPDLSYGEFADRLFGDEEAEPSDDFILAFARAAVEVLEEIERCKLTGRGQRH